MQSAWPSPRRDLPELTPCREAALTLPLPPAPSLLLHSLRILLLPPPSSPPSCLRLVLAPLSSTSCSSLPGSPPERPGQGAVHGKHPRVPRVESRQQITSNTPGQVRSEMPEFRARPRSAPRGLQEGPKGGPRAGINGRQAPRWPLEAFWAVLKACWTHLRPRGGPPSVLLSRPERLQRAPRGPSNEGPKQLGITPCSSPLPLLPSSTALCTFGCTLGNFRNRLGPSRAVLGGRWGPLGASWTALTPYATHLVRLFFHQASKGPFAALTPIHFIISSERPRSRNVGRRRLPPRGRSACFMLVVSGYTHSHILGSAGWPLTCSLRALGQPGMRAGAASH